MSKPDPETPDLGTLERMQRQFGGHPWREAELKELADPQRGMITGFGELLRDLEKIRQRDLPPLPATVAASPGRKDG